MSERVLNEDNAFDLSNIFDNHQLNLIIDSIYARIKFLSSRDSSSFELLKSLCDIGQIFCDAQEYNS